MNIQDIKNMAEKYSQEELENCIDQHLKEGSNACFAGENDEETMNVLSKASYIKKQIEDGKVKDITEGYPAVGH